MTPKSYSTPFASVYMCCVALCGACKLLLCSWCRCMLSLCWLLITVLFAVLQVRPGSMHALHRVL